MDDLRKRFGRLVAVHRRKAGMTQDQLAEAASVSVDMVSKVETGATGARFPLIELLAEALKIDAAELFTSELPTTRRNPVLSELNIKLSSLDDGELLWVKGIIEAEKIMLNAAKGMSYLDGFGASSSRIPNFFNAAAIGK